MYDFYYPLAIDINQSSLRKLNITQNKIVKYSEIIVPEFINITKNNILIKEPKTGVEGNKGKQVDDIYMITGEIIVITITTIAVMYIIWKRRET